MWEYQTEKRTTLCFILGLEIKRGLGHDSQCIARGRVQKSAGFLGGSFCIRHTRVSVM